MEEITNETIIAIHQLRQLKDGVRQTTMQSLDLHWSEGHRLHLRVAELKDHVQKVMRRVETLSGAQAPGCAGPDNRMDFMENQLDVLKSGVATLEQEIAGLFQAQGDHLHGLGEVQAGVQSINAKADQAYVAVRAASDQLKAISNRMDQTAASVVAQAEQLQLQMEEIKAIETRLSRLEALGATNEAAGNADPSQVNVLLESVARLQHEQAQYKGTTTNMQRLQEEVLRETQDQVPQLGMRILKTEEDSRGLKTLDHLGQIEARVQALEDLAKKTEGPKTSPAPGPPEGFDRNAIAHLERELLQVKSYFEGQISTLGQNMDAVMAGLREEHLRPRRVSPMDRRNDPDRPETAPRGPFGGCVPKPSRASQAGPSNPFLYPRRDRPDGRHYETPRYDGVSDHWVPTHDGMPPRGTRDPNADYRHCRGMDLRCFDDEGKLEPGAIEHFPQGEELPKIEPIMGLLRGFAFSEAPTPSGPSLTPTPVDVYPGGGGIPWYGPGVYNTTATPLLDPRALKEVQVWDVVPTWDGDGVKARDWVLSYARWERDVGVALGEGKLIKTLLGAILKDAADPIEKRVIRRNLSFAQVKEDVWRNVNCRVNRYVPDHVFHALTVAKNCSAGDLSNFMEDFIYWDSQVREGVTFGHARQRILDALIHHNGLIYEIYNEENKSGGLEFTYLTLYLFCQAEIRQKDAVKRNQDFQKWRSLPLDKRSNVASLTFIGAQPVKEQVNGIWESEAPPSANDSQVFEPPDEWDEWYANAIGQPVVPKKGPKCPFCGFSGHTEDNCWKKHPHFRKPLIFKTSKPKSGTGRGNPTLKGTGSPKECFHCKMTGHLVDQCWKKHPHLKAEFEAKRGAKRTKF